MLNKRSLKILLPTAAILCGAASVAPALAGEKTCVKEASACAALTSAEQEQVLDLFKQVAFAPGKQSAQPVCEHAAQNTCSDDCRKAVKAAYKKALPVCNCEQGACTKQCKIAHKKAYEKAVKVSCKCEKVACTKACKVAAEKSYKKAAMANKQAHKKLVAFLSEKPGAWDVLAPVIIEKVACEETPLEAQAQVLDILAWNACPTSTKIGTAYYERCPKAFNENHYLAYAERGAEPFVGQLRKKVASACKQGKGKPVQAAAVLAFHGDDTGRVLLEQAVEIPSLDKGCFNQTMLAAAALARLGDDEAWNKTRQMACKIVDRSLEQGHVEYARWMAAKTEYFAKAMASQQAVPVAYLEGRVNEHVYSRQGELESSKQIRALMHKIVTY